MSKTIGQMKEKSTREGKKFYNLEINLPFCPKMEFYVSKNDLKNSPEAKDSAPDFFVSYAQNQVGAIWQKTSQKGVEYLSCEIITPMHQKGKLNFALFADREEPGCFNVSYSEPIERKSTEEEFPY